MKKLSIKYAILLPVGIALCLGVFTVSVLCAVRSNRMGRELTAVAVSETLEHYARELIASGESGLGVARTAVPLLESMRSLYDGRERVVDAFTQILQNHEDIIGIWTVWEPDRFDGRDSRYSGSDYHDDSGRFVPYVHRAEGQVQVEALGDYLDGVYYLTARDEKRITITDPILYSTASGRDLLTISVAVPIVENGEVAGVMGVDLDLSELNEKMNGMSILQSGYLLTVSPGGIIATTPNNVHGRHYTDVWLGGFSEELENLFRDGVPFQGQAYVDYLNADCSITFLPARIPGSNGYWGICAAVPLSEIGASSRRLVLLISFIGAALVLATSAVVILIVRTQLRDLSSITEAAGQLAEGHVGRVPATNYEGVESVNEVFLLKQAFSRMVRTIHTQVFSLQHISQGDLTVEVVPRSEGDHFNAALRDMLDSSSVIFSDIRQAADVVSAGSMQIQSTATGLAYATMEQSAYIEQLFLSVNEVALRAAENEELCDDSAKSSGRVHAIAMQGLEKMRQLSHAVELIGESGENVSKVIDILDDIAFQTNILALNAAVEAAHAGSHGKRFSLVARDIRAMAVKSAMSAHETNLLIEDVLEKTQLGQEVSGQTADILQRIADMVNESNEVIRQIPILSREQTEAIQEINGWLGGITAATQQNSATAQQSAATSQELNAQAELLRNMAARFRLRR